MKKILAYAAPLAMAMSVNVALPAAASAAGGGASNTAEMCRLIAELEGMSVGTCVVYFEKLDAVGLCKLLKDWEMLEYYGYANQGQCIKDNS